MMDPRVKHEDDQKYQEEYQVENDEKLSSFTIIKKGSGLSVLLFVLQNHTVYFVFDF